MQHTIKNAATITGVGLHSGVETTMRLCPAPASSGIVFVRTDVSDRNNRVPALWDKVVDSRLCTLIANEDGVSVGTIEHLMAAIAASGIDNLIVELDGPEVPILDGSSVEFISVIQATGLKAQAAPRRAIKILKEVTIVDGDKTVTLRPDTGMRFDMRIDFSHPFIGLQEYSLDLLEGTFSDEVSSARTFGFLHEVTWMRQQGLALGGSMANAIVLDEQSVMNPEGLRYGDEFVRHKLLDAVGDIYLAGGPILGTYSGFKASHALNNQILRALFAQPDAFAYVDLFVDTVALTGTNGMELPEAVMAQAQAQAQAKSDSALASA